MATEGTTESISHAAKEQSLVPLWDIYHDLVTNEPSPACDPMIWKYPQVSKLLSRAGTEISTEEAERRVLLFKNSRFDKPFTTNALAAGMQLLLKGESEPKHRHSMAALRLVIEGSGGFTTTDGERIWMNPGDVVTTPSWTWHDHGKETDGELIWLDGIDAPMVRSWQLNFADYGEDGIRESQTLTKADAESHYRYGSGFLPVGMKPDQDKGYSPIYSYPYSRTREILHKLQRDGDWDDHLGIKLKLSNPLNGEHFMPTIAGFMQLLPSQSKTKAYRSTDSQIYSVVEGSGTVKIGDQVFEFAQSDVFVVPNWTWFELIASEESVLFSFSDRAAQERLYLWREQRSR